MDETKLSRRERERLQQRKEILDAALSLFSEKGFHNVSIRQIAEKSEFAVGTLYKFFKNKEDLYTSLIKEQADKFHVVIIKALDQGKDEVEKLRNYVKAKCSVFRDNVSVIRLYFAETRGASFNVRAGLDKDIRERYDQVLHTKLAPVFESGMRKKIFKRIAKPYQLAVALDAVCNSFLFLWLDSPETVPFPEADSILNIIFKGLIP